MKATIPYGCEAIAGKYECADCGHVISSETKMSIPPCPNYSKDTHPKKYWNISKEEKCCCSND